MSENENSAQPIPVKKYRRSRTAFENTDTALHQLLKVCESVHDENDDSIRINIPEPPPEPSHEGLFRRKVAQLMHNVEARIRNGQIDSARSLYHYFIEPFRNSLKPDLDLPPLSALQPPIDLPQQDLLVTIIRSAGIADRFHEKGLNSGWDSLNDETKEEITAEAVSSDASIELVKLGKFRLNRLAKLISNTGGWQDGSSYGLRIWTQAEVDEAVPIVAPREDAVSLLMRFEYFLKRCYPSIVMPPWNKPAEVTSMTEEEIESELASDFRNDYIIENAFRGIVSISKQPPVTPEQFYEQVRRSREPYARKLLELITTHINPSDPPEDKLEQIRIIVNTHHQHWINEGDLEQIEIMWKLVKWLRRRDNTWEDVERWAIP